MLPTFRLSDAGERIVRRASAWRFCKMALLSKAARLGSGSSATLTACRLSQLGVGRIALPGVHAVEDLQQRVEMPYASEKHQAGLYKMEHCTENRLLAPAPRL